MSESRKYIPEFDYESRDFKPYGGPPSPDMCRQCKFYYKNLQDLGNTKDEFPIKCFGHTGDTAAEIISAIDEDEWPDKEELALAKSTLDPVLWAQTELNWTPRWYQEWMLSCSSDSKLYRLGRRCGKSNVMCVEGLFTAITKENQKIMICAPGENQIEMLFDMLHEFIRGSNTLQQAVQTSSKSPYRLIFKNGSKISGFPITPNQGDSARKVRGQDAHLIIFDEFDFLNDKDIEVIFAIRASHADTRIIAATTPSGARKKFYSLCTDKNLGWKEFHFISMESPVWSERFEETERASKPQAQFDHEYNAIFGELEAGLFKSGLIEASLQRYDMDNIEPEPNQRYVLGIDWNKSHGSHMVIVQHQGDKLKLVKKIIIPESEYMQTTTVDEIIRLHRKWNFRYIFLDAGYGHTQVELLKKYGVQNPGTRLHEILRPLVMNQRIPIRDPHTGKEELKYMKPYLVYQTVKMLEDGNLVLPKSEDTNATGSELMGLVQQMRNYSVVGFSTYGQPQFTKENDHTIVAYMSACAGWVYEEGELSQMLGDVPVYGVEISAPTDDLPGPGEYIGEKQYEEIINRRNANAKLVRDLDKLGANQADRTSMGNSTGRKKLAGPARREFGSFRRKTF